MSGLSMARISGLSLARMSGLSLAGLLTLLPALASGQYRDLTNITDAVFGTSPESRSFIPAAFGDFNSDKLTDLVVLKNDRLAVEVLLAREQKVVSSGSDPPLFHGRPSHNLECNAPEGKIVSAVPADFDGDGGMDLMMVTSLRDTLTVRIFWGSQAAGSSLDCSEETRLKVELREPGSNTSMAFKSQPLVIDYNRDYIADLLFVTSGGKRTVAVFSNRTFSLKYLTTDRSELLKTEHSSAFLDLNGDGGADLLLTTTAGLELYGSSEGKDGFTFNRVVPWPALPDCTVDSCIGQAVFADFDLDGKLDLLLPACFDPKCSNSSLLQVGLEKLWNWDEARDSWAVMSLELGSYRFLPPDTSSSPLRLLSPRVGDVDLDGFPDLLLTLYNTSLGPPSAAIAETMLLLNTHCGQFAACHPYWRQFQVQPSFTLGTGPSITATFFDLYEDGKLDLLVVDEKSSAVTAWTNTTQNSDAYFIKVIVLSGACYHDCPKYGSSYVPYGTNSGGQVVGYTSQRAGPEQFASYSSVAAQLPQTSHFPLQLPYTIFGLGLAPNFVDYMWVNVSASRSHTWPQIIPNSQLYVIPYPRDDPGKWDAKLIIFTSKNIVITGLSLVGVCGLVSIIIVLLHMRERRLDHQAKLQEAHRFHFDAM